MTTAPTFVPRPDIRRGLGGAVPVLFQDCEVAAIESLMELRERLLGFADIAELFPSGNGLSNRGHIEHSCLLFIFSDDRA
jgi:hypothetical protein